MLPFAIFAIHSFYFKSWIVDDAGISFAYARNLSELHGLVSQPGVAPVEGYSNFTWILLMVPFFLAGLFDPVITPKILSLALVLLSFICLHLTFRNLTNQFNLITAGVLLLLAVNTSFVVWTTSGLENPLLVLLLTLFLYLAIRFNADDTRRRYLIILGALAAMIAMTRPDGVAYSLTLPAYWLFGLFIWRWPLGKTLKDGLVYSASFAALFCSFLLFRWQYFGAIFPNTYYAKGGTFFSEGSSAPLANQLLKKTWDLFYGILPVGGVMLMAVLVGITVYLIKKKHFKENHLVMFLLLLISTGVFVILPADWMGEFRFATAFFLFYYSYVFIIGEVFIKTIVSNRSTGTVLTGNRLTLMITLGIAGFVVFWSTFHFIPRTRDFAARPTISFNDVSDKYAFLFNRYAERLDLQNGSIILPDLGGMLYYSDLRVYDLAGLCDRTIAKTFNHDQEAFYDYIFETLKPSMIFTHSEFTDLARFDLDSRFRRDYVPVYEYRDSQIDAEYSAELYSGVFIRRELAQGRQDITSEFSGEVEQALK